ncbi:anti-sigma factor [Aliikangiella sp. IMCC44632]
MNYHNTELAEQLAKRYVLGIMSGRARTRFSQLMMKYNSLQQAVWHWEQLLNPLSQQLPPAQLPSQMWLKITAQLGWTKEPTRFSLKRFFGLGVPVFASILFAWLVLFQFNQTTPVTAIASLQIEAPKVAWVAKRQNEAILVIAQNPPKTETEIDFELWMLPKDGTAPISLGLLPKQGEKRLVDLKRIASLLESGLAVSQEPLGGSPTGQPTGPVILTAQWVII